MSKFSKELEDLINKNCIEDDSDTPDFLLAEYLIGCLEMYSRVTKKRDKWFSFTPFENSILPKEKQNE